MQFKRILCLKKCVICSYTYKRRSFWFYVINFKFTSWMLKLTWIGNCNAFPFSTVTYFWVKPCIRQGLWDSSAFWLGRYVDVDEEECETWHRLIIRDSMIQFFLFWYSIEAFSIGQYWSSISCIKMTIVEVSYL